MQMLFKDISHLAAEEMSFEYISCLELCSAEQTCLCNFGNVNHEEQFCEIISNLD